MNQTDADEILLTKGEYSSEEAHYATFTAYLQQNRFHCKEQLFGEDSVLRTKMPKAKKKSL